MRRLVRIYLVRTILRNGLSASCKKNLFFFKFKKDIPNERNALIALRIHVLHVKNRPQRSKLFNQLLKLKIYLLRARADRLTY